MDLFDRNFDSSDGIRSGAAHLSAAAARLAMSIVLSIPHLPDAAWSEFKRLLTVDTLWGLCIVLAGWLIATIIGGVVGLAVNGLLIAYGVVELWAQLKAVAGSVTKWANTAYYATNLTELSAAGKHFAAALSAGGLTLVEILVTHRAFRAVEGQLRQVIPVPEWLRSQYEDALRQRERVMRPEPEPARKSSRVAAKESVKKAADIAGGLRGSGAKRVAENFPSEAVVVAGALLGIAVVSGVAVAFVGSSRRAR